MVNLLDINVSPQRCYMVSRHNGGRVTPGLGLWTLPEWASLIVQDLSIWSAPTAGKDRDRHRDLANWSSDQDPLGAGPDHASLRSNLVLARMLS